MSGGKRAEKWGILGGNFLDVQTINSALPLEVNQFDSGVRLLEDVTHAAGAARYSLADSLPTEPRGSSPRNLMEDTDNLSVKRSSMVNSVPPVDLSIILAMVEAYY